MVRLGINGFGRIGRCAYRVALESGIPITAVNGTADPATLAHLLKYDSTYGTLRAPIDVRKDAFSVDGCETALSFQRDPAAIPWKDLGVDVVLECTGYFTERADLEKHRAAGAAKVIVAAPAKGEDITIVLGVNEGQYDPAKHNLISNASCTTNCLAPVAKVLHDAFGIERGLMTTIHAYTGDQRILDGTHKDLRRARAAGLSLVPTSTGAAKAIGKVIPELDGRLHGFAVRVPTPTVSAVDLTAILGTPASADEINGAFKAAASRLRGILAASDEPLVSMDFRGNPHSAVVDCPSTMASGSLAKVMAWYDNEWAYAKRLVELAVFVMNEGGD